MPTGIINTVPAIWSGNEHGRFASTIITDDPKDCAVALLGIPDDTGVCMNKGRPGAAKGPFSFREALSKLGAAEPAFFSWPRIFDAGDILVGKTLVDTHSRVTEATLALLDLGLFPMAVGGGHDLTFPFVRAVAQKSGTLDGVYFDAHLDVRETEGSGMAFRRLIEECGVSSLYLHGFRPLSNSREHYNWFKANGGHLQSSLTQPMLPRHARNLFASFDLDVIDMAHAPGVSAPNPSGWTPREAERWVFECGADPRMRCFDIMELCPDRDEGGRTARLAAHLFLTFLSGFASRT